MTENSVPDANRQFNSKAEERRARTSMQRIGVSEDTYWHVRLNNPLFEEGKINYHVGEDGCIRFNIKPATIEETREALGITEKGVARVRKIIDNLKL